MGGEGVGEGRKGERKWRGREGEVRTRKEIGGKGREEKRKGGGEGREWDGYPCLSAVISAPSALFRGEADAYILKLCQASCSDRMWEVIKYLIILVIIY